MNSSKGLIVVIVLFAAAAFIGGYVWRESKQDDTLSEETPTPDYSQVPVVSRTPLATPTVSGKPQRFTIRLTSSGVQPALLQIHAGDEVTFRNETDAAFWPASIPHPTHSVCPGFDALRVLRKDELYSLTFPTAKTCGYHNHVAPADTTMQGTIVVQ